MSKYFTFDETKEYFESHGYKVLDQEINHILISTKINVEDEEGYKYFISRHRFYAGNRNNNIRNSIIEYIPQKLGIQNPHTIDNIKRWITINNKPFSFYDGEYTTNSQMTLFFKCNICSEIWNAKWLCMQMGSGCPYCAGKRISFNNSLAKYRPDLVEEWDYEKNHGLKPENIAPRSEKIIWWKCKQCGHNWKATPSNRNSNREDKRTNCTRCSRSSGEIKISNILTSIGVIYDYEKKFDDCRLIKPLSFDFYLPDFNICIEYQGRQHYRPVTFGNCAMDEAVKNYKIQKASDNKKEEYCKNNNIQLVQIPYWEFDNIEVILKSHLGISEL